MFIWFARKKTTAANTQQPQTGPTANEATATSTAPSIYIRAGIASKKRNTDIGKNSKRSNKTTAAAGTKHNISMNYKRSIDNDGSEKPPL